MDVTTILLKTPRGRDEIRTRAHPLPRLARRALILADGEQTIEQLAADLGRDPRDRDLQTVLDTLVAEKYLFARDDQDPMPREHQPRRGWHAVRC